MRSPSMLVQAITLFRVKEDDMRMKLILALVPVFAGGLLLSSATVRADCEVCHDAQGRCGDGIFWACYSGYNPDGSTFCADEPMDDCSGGGFASIEGVDAAGLPANRAAADRVAQGVGHVTRACDDAVLRFQFNAEDAAALRAASTTIVI